MLPAADRADGGDLRPLMMQLRLLGSFELRRLDGARIALPGRQSVAIIACLGLPRGFHSLAIVSPTWSGRVGASRRTGAFGRNSFACAVLLARMRCPWAGRSLSL